MRLIHLILPAALITGLASIPNSMAAGSAEKGRAAYVNNGCWQCHGFAGQGGITGPKLAPDPLPFNALSAFIRSSKGPMPPYQEAILSNADLADIYAYLQSIPKARDYKSIPQLDQ
jgi:mono/diheme cytochrome c family protein